MGTLASPLVERRDGGCGDAGRGRLRRPSWCLDTWVIYGSTKYNGGKHLAPSFVVLRYMGGDAYVAFVVLRYKGGTLASPSVKLRYKGSSHYSSHS